MRMLKFGFMALLFMFAATGVVSAQALLNSLPDWRSSRTGGVGFVSNMPRALAGATAFLITPKSGGVGMYASYRQTHESHERDEEFTSGVTVEQAETEFGDEFMREVEHWRAVSVGVVRPLTAELAVFAGAGYAKERRYAEYHDLTGERGSFGHYRVLDGERSGGRLNLNGGAIFRFGRRLGFHFGAESAPAGFLAGASLMF